MDNQINSLLPGNYPSISTSPEFMQSPSLSSGQAPRCAQCPLRTEQDRPFDFASRRSGQASRRVGHRSVFFNDTSLFHLFDSLF